MDLSIIDILLIVTIVILLAIIIVLNVLYFVDGRITTLMKSIDNKLNKCTDDKDNTEGFDSNTGKMSIASRTTKPLIYLQQGYASSPSDKPKLIDANGEFMYYPDHDDILRYGGKGCYRGINTEKVRKVELVEPDFNKSCARLDAEIEGNNPMSHPNIRPKTHKMSATVIGAQGEESSTVLSVHVPPTYLSVTNALRGNPTFRDDVRYFNGVNGSVLSYPADIDQIGSIPVNNYEGEPVPVGSAL